MSEMIEHVAKALMAASNDQLDSHVRPHSWDKSDERLWFMYQARAAIEALREPSDAMVDAAWQHTGHPCWQEDVKRAWQAAITAALGEGGE